MLGLIVAGVADVYSRGTRAAAARMGVDLECVLEGAADRQPGSDGGKMARRFEKEAFPEQQTPQPDPLVLTTCAEVLACKVRSGGTELAARLFLAAAAAQFSRQATEAEAAGRSEDAEAARRRARQLPDSLKKAMSLLEASNMAQWAERYVYDQCSNCHFLYRHTYYDDFRCATTCPDCRVTRWVCARTHSLHSHALARLCHPACHRRRLHASHTCRWSGARCVTCVP